jgi:hypothetical protein
MTPEPDKDINPVDSNSAKGLRTSSAKDSASYIEEIDRRYTNGFRNLLEEYRSTIATDISEIAEGLQLSRPVVGDFMNGKREDLPLSIGRIVHLHKILSDPDRLSKKRPGNRAGSKSEKDSPNIQQENEQNQGERQSTTQARKEAKDKRIDLGINGPDRLLIEAGFQPYRNKMIPVSSQQYSQLSLIRLMYNDRAIGQDLFMQIIQQEIEHIGMRSGQKELSSDQGKASEYLLNEIKNTTWMSGKRKQIIETNYKKAQNATDKKPEEFNDHENLGLLSSILHNQLQEEEEIKFRLRVDKIETIPLASFIPTKIKGERVSRDANEFLDRIDNIGIAKCEYDLGNPPREETDKKSIRPIHPVTRTIVTCRDGDDLIKFEYISAGTHLSTAICAISLNMGLNEAIKSMKIDVRCLGKDIQSLVKASVTLGENNKLVLGEWVESDLIKSLIQAMIVAGRRWLYKEIPSGKLDEYKKIVKNMAEIRSMFYEQRIIYDGYDFNDSRTSVDKFIDINSQSAKWIEYILKIQSESSEIAKIWNTFISSFNRIRILSQIYILHHRNIQVSHSQCRSLLEKIDADFNSINIEAKSQQEELDRNYKSKLVRSSKISFEAEKIAYNLSFGIPWRGDSTEEEAENLLQSNNLLESLQKLDKIIDNCNYLKKLSKENRTADDNTDSAISKYPVYDMHYSLGSYHSIVGRVLFYKATSQEEIQESCDRFLRAVYFFEKIGLTRKVERNLTLAGRANVRSGQIKNADACKELSEFILDKHALQTNAKIDGNFKLSMESRLNLLKGEYSRLLQSNGYASSLNSCLESLRGALWLGLNRHIVDNLYTISRCADEMGNTEYNLMHFDELDLSMQLIDIHKVFISVPEENLIAQRVISMLYDIGEKAVKKKATDNPLKWRDVAKEFRDKSASIWTSWYREATGDETGEHPFATEITKQDSRFLDLI